MVVENEVIKGPHRGCRFGQIPPTMAKSASEARGKAWASGVRPQVTLDLQYTRGAGGLGVHLIARGLGERPFPGFADPPGTRQQRHAAYQAASVQASIPHLFTLQPYSSSIPRVSSCERERSATPGNSREHTPLDCIVLEARGGRILLCICHSP